jgi:hypothetical protein
LLPPQDFKSDVENCGKCGHRCAPGFACTNGVCDNEKLFCLKGQTECKGKCVVSVAVAAKTDSVVGRALTLSQPKKVLAFGLGKLL